MEAVDFVHAEGWDAAPTLFGLVPTQLLVDELDTLDDSAPLTLVVQDLPETILPGSEELGEYVTRLAWPREVEGVILAQEILFRDANAPADAEPLHILVGLSGRGDKDIAHVQDSLDKKKEK